MAINEIEIKSWKYFLEFATKLDIGNPRAKAYSFRGQSNSSWELIPKLIRNYNGTEVDALSIEAKALAEFQSEAHAHLSPNIFSKTADTISWWTIMQHHGAPTRLLDWTESIFVAAYFAVTENFPDNGAIWSLHLQSANEAMMKKFGEFDAPKTEDETNQKYLKPGGNADIVSLSRKSKTERMILQQGRFTICKNILGNHGKILSDLIPPDNSKHLFDKLIIPASQKIEFIRKLKTMNISASTLFQGIDGLGKSIQEYVKILSQTAI